MNLSIFLLWFGQGYKISMVYLELVKLVHFTKKKKLYGKLLEMGKL